MKDANFLRVHGIMDYSLLLAIEKKVPEENKGRESLNG